MSPCSWLLCPVRLCYTEHITKWWDDCLQVKLDDCVKYACNSIIALAYQVVVCLWLHFRKLKVPVHAYKIVFDHSDHKQIFIMVRMVGPKEGQGFLCCYHWKQEWVIFQDKLSCSRKDILNWKNSRPHEYTTKKLEPVATFYTSLPIEPFKS